MTVLQSLAQSYVKARTANATDSSFAAKNPTSTAPSGTGVVEVSRTGVGPADLLLVFFGEGADNTTFDVRVIGWSPVGSLWVPTLIAQMSCTLSAVVGVAGYDVTASERFADTISLGNGIAVVTNPASDAMPATALVDVAGYRKAEVVFDMTGATNGNALCRLG